MSTPARKHIAKAIYFTTWVGTITVLWQAVRFCQGHVGAIALDQIIALTNQILGADPEAVSSEVVSSPLQMAMVPYFKAIYFFGGIGAWFGSAGIVLISGLSFGKIIEVGPSYKLQRADTSNETVALPDTYVINCHSRMILKVRQRVLKDVTHVRWDKPLDRSRIFYSETLQKERLACSTPSAKM